MRVTAFWPCPLWGANGAANIGDASKLFRTAAAILVFHKGMPLRWSLILPVLGLILFGAVTYRSMPANHHEQETPRKYYWWSSLRLDSDPLNEDPQLAAPCANQKQNCSNGEFPNVKIAPSWLDRLLIVSALPAFLAAAAIVVVLSKLGLNEVLTFMVCIPILLFVWYYSVGWLIERWSKSQSQAKSVPPEPG
jgi:hypothetical protein